MITRRLFSTSQVLEKSLKGKLKALLQAKDEARLPAARRDSKVRQKERIRTYQKTKENEQVLQQHLDEYFSDLSNVISKTPDFAPKHPAVYRYLGTSKIQLKNPYVVSDEVRKLLKKNKVAHAAFVVRLAGDNGSVGMNQILQHLSTQNQHSLALKLFNRMKKWGTKENELTNVTLQGRSKDSGKVLKSFERAKEKISEGDKKRAVVNVNATLKALSGTNDVEAIAEVYDSVVHKDVITYTTALNALARCGPTAECEDLKDRIWQEVEDEMIEGFEPDARLVRAYLIAHTTSRPKALESYHVLRNHFGIPGTGYKGKLPFTRAELDVLLKILWQLDDHRAVVKRFESSHDLGLEWSHYHYYVKSLSQTGDISKVPAILPKLSGEKPAPSTIYADLLRTYLHCPIAKADPETMEQIKKQCQQSWGKRLHIAMVDAYAHTFARIYADNVEHKLHPRHGLKALNDIARSYQVFGHNLTEGKHVAECKNAIAQAAKLGHLVYNHPAWQKHRFIWVQKMTEICDLFSIKLNEDSVTKKDIEEFVYDLDTIVRRGQGKTVNSPVMPPVNKNE